MHGGYGVEPAVAPTQRLAQRRVLGFGTGWSPEEYQAAGVPMNERGRRLDECLDILDAFWTTNPVEYHGRFWTIPATYADLKPVQRPRPPIYLAGFTSAAKRRIARRADGWLPTVVVPGQLRPSAIAGTMAELREAARQAGRDPDALGMVLRINPLAGTRLADIVDVITGARDEAGVDHAFVELMYPADDVDRALHICERLMDRRRTL
jgi:alkanesulfonate monooxygenase SsuD/methylene tetrahydromethanopterin reductase-like flavin-dependent oxidoreductase (luciferase family)